MLVLVTEAEIAGASNLHFFFRDWGSTHLIRSPAADGHVLGSFLVHVVLASRVELSNLEFHLPKE